MKQIQQMIVDELKVYSLKSGITVYNVDIFTQHIDYL